jgi:hypothetical protein
MYEQLCVPGDYTLGARGRRGRMEGLRQGGEARRETSTQIRRQMD